MSMYSVCVYIHTCIHTSFQHNTPETMQLAYSTPSTKCVFGDALPAT